VPAADEPVAVQAPDGEPQDQDLLLPIPVRAKEPPLVVDASS
jgi:hypothetical protein